MNKPSIEMLFILLIGPTNKRAIPVCFLEVDWLYWFTIWKFGERRQMNYAQSQIMKNKSKLPRTEATAAEERCAALSLSVPSLVMGGTVAIALASPWNFRITCYCFL